MRQRPASSHAFSTRRWGQQQGAQQRGTRALEPSTFHLHEDLEHEHEHTSTCEDDLLKLLGMSEDTQSGTRFDSSATGLLL